MTDVSINAPAAKNLYGGRRRRNAIVLTLSFAATAIGLGILALILGTLVVESFRGLSMKVFTCLLYTSDAADE